MPATSTSKLLAGRYETVEWLGEGGMADVYSAVDVRRAGPRRKVALKILKPNLSEDPDAVKRFEREGRAMKRFEHPHIAKVLDRKRDGNVHFLVMELINGRSARKLLQERSRGFSPRDAVAIVSQVCEALEYAHSHGIIHRDVKPENVMIEGAFREGQVPHVKVTDFGIALAKEGTRLTQSGGVVGTLPYVPAEVAKGEEASERSDVYACGTVLYELLTGKTPFTGKTLPQVLAEQEAGPPPAPATVRRGIPKRLSDATLVAMALYPDGRFESARDLRDAVRAGLADRDFGEFLPTRLIRPNERATPRTLYRAMPREGSPGGYQPQDSWAALLTFIAVISVLLVMLEVTLRLSSAVATTPPWGLALAVLTGLSAFGLRRSPIFSADPTRREAARARLRRTTRRRFRTLVVLCLLVLWATLGYYLFTDLKVRISQQPAPSHLWLEIGSAALWLIAFIPFLMFARTHRTIGRTAAWGALVAVFWVFGAIGLAAAPKALGPLWSRPPLAKQVRSEGRQWIQMLRHPDRRTRYSHVGALRRRLAKSRNSVLQTLRHADTKAERRRAKRKAHRWMRSMRHARHAWHKPRCHATSARLLINSLGARAVCD